MQRDEATLKRVLRIFCGSLRKACNPSRSDRVLRNYLADNLPSFITRVVLPLAVALEPVDLTVTVHDPDPRSRMVLD